MWQGHMPIFLLFTPLDPGHHAKGYNIPMVVLKKREWAFLIFLVFLMSKNGKMADWIDWLCFRCPMRLFFVCCCFLFFFIKADLVFLEFSIWGAQQRVFSFNQILIKIFSFLRAHISFDTMYWLGWRNGSSWWNGQIGSVMTHDEWVELGSSSSILIRPSCIIIR